ncbi:MAG: site-specific tyrosine recombinase/integron integrase [Candidatus Hodarchaeota archaeon]
MRNDELIEAFLIFLEVEKNYSTNTCSQYRYDLRLFFKFIEKEADNVATLDLRRFLIHLKKDRNYAPTSIHRKICSLRSFYKFLEKEGYISKDPTSTIASPKVPKSLPKFLTIEEVDRLLAMVSNVRDRAIIELLYSTGMRVSELCTITLDDIDLEKKLIKVQQAKGSKQRYVLFGGRAELSLRDYLYERKLKAAPEEKAVFLNRFGTRMHPITVQRIVAKYRKQAELPETTTPHMLRHTFASHLIQNGTDIRFIQELLGHNSLSTTQIYTHIETKHLRKAYDQAHPFSSRDETTDL